MTRPPRQPDQLAAEARRWIGKAGDTTDAKVVAAVLEGLRSYYGDVVVVEGIVAWRQAHGARPGQPAPR